MPLTIGMFTDTYVPEINGVVTSVFGTAQALRRRGHRVIIVAPAHGRDEESDPDVFRFRSTPFPFYPQLRMAFPLPAKVIAALPRIPFDVVHAHSFFFVGCLGAYLAQLRRIPLFFTYHTRWTEYTHYLPVHERITNAQAVWISREFSNRCERVIAPTRGVADMLATYGVHRPIEIVPTGVDISQFAHDGEDSRLGDHSSAVDSSRRLGLLNVGRLGKEQNLVLLLVGCAEINARLRRRQLHICISVSGGNPQGLPRPRRRSHLWTSQGLPAVLTGGRPRGSACRLHLARCGGGIGSRVD